MRSKVIRESERLRTPRAAAAAGIAFSVLLSTCYILMRVAVPQDPSAESDWLGSRDRAITLALAIAPFAGIAFLWFIGVVRDHLGEREDRFFSTVFLGSGLLFLAMSFTAAAIAGGLQDTYASHPTEMVDSGLYLFARETLWRLSNIFAVKMSAVFMLSLGTIWLRTRAMPRFFAVITYSMAVVMLFSISLNLWATMLFPIWVFLVSLRILKVNRLGRAAPASVGVGED